MRAPGPDGCRDQERVSATGYPPAFRDHSCGMMAVCVVGIGCSRSSRSGRGSRRPARRRWTSGSGRSTRIRSCCCPRRWTTGYPRDLTPAEIRRLPAAQPGRHPARRDHAVNGSRWRRRHQARARRCHYMRRGHSLVDGRPKTVPLMPNPRYTPHRQAVDEEKYRSPAGVLNRKSPDRLLLHFLNGGADDFSLVLWRDPTGRSGLTRHPETPARALPPGFAPPTAQKLHGGP